MSFTTFLSPDLFSSFITVVKEIVVSRIVRFSENFFSRYRKDHFNQLEFLDTNLYLQKDLSIIVNALVDEWTNYIPENTYLSRFNHVLFRIQPDDFTFYTGRGQIFETVLLASTPTVSAIRSGILMSLTTASESGLRDFVKLNRGIV